MAQGLATICSDLKVAEQVAGGEGHASISKQELSPLPSLKGIEESSHVVRDGAALYARLN